MIEVGHNPDQLMYRAKVRVRNVLAADKAIRKMMDEKRKRGMRLRYTPDFVTRSYYLEARERGILDVALSVLRNDRNIIEVQKHFKPLGDI